VAQFRVEFVLDQASGKYLAELYNPENHQDLIVRTEALYPTQASAVLGLVELFKDAILKFPAPGTPARTKRTKTKAGTKRKAKKTATKRRAGRARTSARRKPRKRARR
jgi:hypothetical protein